MTTTQFRTGAPCWIDFGTHDLPASAAFYRDLFDWTVTDQGPESGHYHLISAGDTVIGGMMDTTGMTCPEGGDVPTRWDVYLASSDLKTTVERAKRTGRVYIDIEQVGSYGSMAVMADPSGAGINAWQADELAGFTLPLTHGTPMWFECRTTDFDAALAFYQEVFEWEAVPMDSGPESAPRYATNGSVTGTLSDGTSCEAVCGIADAAAMPPELQYSTWMIFFGTSDLDASLESARRLGATTGEVGASPFGRFSQVTDPHGGQFMLNEL